MIVSRNSLHECIPRYCPAQEKHISNEDGSPIGLSGGALNPERQSFVDGAVNEGREGFNNGRFHNPPVFKSKPRLKECPI
ncbi:hypothetical protein J6590_034672 [Homalodisca vitripennis]|nr:hypothetical protein J6590_034672 [Homalodisca vitripennis]